VAEAQVIMNAVTGECPCTGCRLAGRCAEGHEACAAFAMFVHGQPESRWQAAPRAPSTARYAALFRDPRRRRRRAQM